MKKFLYGAFFGAFVFKPLYDYGKLFLAKLIEGLCKPPYTPPPSTYDSYYHRVRPKSAPDYYSQR